MSSPRKCHTFMHNGECDFFGESLRGVYIVFKAELWEVRIGVIYPGLKLWKCELICCVLWKGNFILK